MTREEFKDFIRLGINQSLDVLESNPKFDVIIDAITDMFYKLYNRVYDIKLTNTANIFSDDSFQRFLAENVNTDGSYPDKLNKNIILDHISLYLDTDHFKKTLARMLKLWQDRFNSGYDEEEFIRQHIIPSFKYFTRFAGDLHKTKGTVGLIERFFDFYGPVNDSAPSFDGVEEVDRDDPYGIRFRLFSSVRTGVEDKLVMKRYTNLYNSCGKTILDDIKVNKIVKYLETQYHKLVILDIEDSGNQLFVSKKERDDYHHQGPAQDIYEINELWFVVINGTKVSVFKDEEEYLDDDLSYETDAPAFVPHVTYDNLRFIPKVINIEDEFNEYHLNNFWYIEEIKDGPNNPKPGYYLARIKYDRATDTISRTYYVDSDDNKQKLSFCFDPQHKSQGLPAFNVKSIDHIWFDFGEDDLEEGEFFDTNNHPWRMIYSTRMLHRYSDINEDITQSSSLNIWRDGNEYKNPNFGRVDLGKIRFSSGKKYIFQEREINPVLEGLLKNHTHGIKKIKGVFDVIVPDEETRINRTNYNNRGEWNPNLQEFPTNTQLKTPVKKFNSVLVSDLSIYTSDPDEIFNLTAGEESSLWNFDRSISFIQSRKSRLSIYNIKGRTS
jgi:hypothetical protein